MRRIDFLITSARRLSRNEDTPTTTSGIPDEEFIQYINDGQDRLQSLLCATKNINKIFATQKILSLVVNQEEYTIPDRVFLNKEFIQVEFSSSGAAGDYVVLDKVHLFNRDTNTSNYPVGYYRRSGKIYVNPIPSTSTGTLRVIYERTLDDLDKRRGQITTVNGLSSTTFTDIVINSTADETSTPNLSTIDYICIVDKDGNRKAYNIPVGNYNTGTNTLTPTAGFTFEAGSGDTIAVGDYVVFGKYTTTHSQLPDDAERYLIHYCAEMIFHRDSSTDVSKQSEKLQAMETDIIKAVGSQTSEIAYVPQLNRYDWY